MKLLEEIEQFKKFVDYRIDERKRKVVKNNSNIVQEMFDDLGEII